MTYILNFYSDNIIVSNLAKEFILVDSSKIEEIRKILFKEGNFSYIISEESDKEDLKKELEKKGFLKKDFSKKFEKNRIKSGMRRKLLINLLNSNLPAFFAMELMIRYNFYLSENYKINPFTETGFIRPKLSEDMKNNLLTGYAFLYKEISPQERQEIFKEFKEIVSIVKRNFNIGNDLDNLIQSYIKQNFKG